MSPRIEGHASVAITANRGLPVPTKPVGYAKRTPVRSGHVPIKCGTAEGYERHRELGMKPCEPCLKAIKPKPLKKAKRPLPPVEHGKERGYYQHRRRQEPACDECKAALRTAQNARKAGEGGPTFDVRGAQADREAGMPTVEVAEKYGVSRQSIWRWTTGPHGKRPMSDYQRIDIARLRELWEQGMTDPQIAAALECDSSTVGRRRRGLKLRAHGKSGVKGPTT